MKLIDKDALVTELNKLNKRFTNLDYPEYVDGYHYGINSVISFINTLEVKEVDLDKEVEHWRNMMPVIIGKKWLSRFAKYFFEQGLKARKEE